VRGRLRVINAVDLQKPVRREPRWFARPGSPHYWSRLSIRSGFWLASQYRYVPRAAGVFFWDLSRFAALKVAYQTTALAASARAMWRGRVDTASGVPPAPPARPRPRREAAP
jgi:hypothetical protein